MFEVHAVSPLDAGWEGRDALVVRAAGRPYDFAGSARKYRTLGWNVPTIQEAVAMRKRLREVPLVRATLREKTTKGAR